MLRVARFLRCYLRPLASVRAEEVAIEVGGTTVPATLYRVPGPLAVPGWVVLHGMTVPGRHHASLTRFARALAAAGGAVLVPDIRPWRELTVDPCIADTVIVDAARYLAGREDVLSGGVTVVGFSFGATQALVSAADPERREIVRAVVGFGGYCDLHRALGFMMTGEHEWAGVRYQAEPDPYGRWIVAANYLTAVPGLSDLGRVAGALRELSLEVGRRGTFAGDPLYDPLKDDLRAGLRRREREVWDLLAPPAATRPATDEARDLADRLAEAALQVHPSLDPRPLLPTLDRRLVLAHGHRDRLIPFTESLRIRALLGPSARAHTTITRLFAHSREADHLRLHRYPVELLRYLLLLRQALRTE